MSDKDVKIIDSGTNQVVDTLDHDKKLSDMIHFNQYILTGGTVSHRFHFTSLCDREGGLSDQLFLVAIHKLRTALSVSSANRIFSQCLDWTRRPWAGLHLELQGQRGGWL